MCNEKFLFKSTLHICKNRVTVVCFKSENTCQAEINFERIGLTFYIDNLQWRRKQIESKGGGGLDLSEVSTSK